MKKPVIAIPLGDPGGIGPEVTFKALRASGLHHKARCIVIGSLASIHAVQKRLKAGQIPAPLRRYVQPELGKFRVGQHRIFFIDIQEDARKLYNRRSKKKAGASFFNGLDKGKVSLRNAAIAYASMQKAAELAKEGMAQAVVTAPVNKTAMRLIDPAFKGHTEFLAKYAGVKSFAMMFASSRLKVTLATIHVPIRGVSRFIRRKTVLEKIALTDRFLRERFKIRRPKVGVCALNPHGRETGTEEDLEILPALKTARKRKINALGPFSADQLFFDAYEGRFDAVISMYHDQGLAPFKMIAFHEGVNVTLGLPYVRTSPDHGTAFDIAYQGKADHRSMLAALRLAVKLV